MISGLDIGIKLNPNGCNMMPSSESIASAPPSPPSERLWKLVFDLAKAEGMSAPSLKNWRQRGVPRSWHSRLLLRARARRVRLSVAELELLSTTKRRRG